MEGQVQPKKKRQPPGSCTRCSSSAGWWMTELGRLCSRCRNTLFVQRHWLVFVDPTQKRISPRKNRGFP